VVRRISTITMMAAALLISTTRADEPLSGSMEARKVVQQKSGRELLVPAKEVHPKDVIEYRLTYANNSEGALKNVSVVDPIPAGTEYVSLSATRPQAGAVEFSIDDGSTYHAWPVHYKKTLEDGTEVVMKATPQMVSHIRWTIAGEFEPESEITLSYRATVK
jgi:uncharacterized repeat protein (TIGR01451 family)